MAKTAVAPSRKCDFQNPALISMRLPLRKRARTATGTNGSVQVNWLDDYVAASAFVVSPNATDGESGISLGYRFIK